MDFLLLTYRSKEEKEALMDQLFISYRCHKKHTYLHTYIYIIMDMHHYLKYGPSYTKYIGLINLVNGGKMKTSHNKLY